MRAANTTLLLYAALLIESAAAAIRQEILHHHHRRRFLQSNTSRGNSQDDFSTTETTRVGATIPESTDFLTKHNLPSISAIAPVPTTDDAVSGLLSSSASPSVSPSPITALASGAEVSSFKRTSSYTATEGVYITGDPSQASELVLSSATGLSAEPSIIACGHADTPECSSASSATDKKPIAFPTNSSLLTNTFSIESCTPLPSGKAVTEYSIVYTSTITFYGNSSDYTPPYAPITTPNYCPPPGEALITFFSTSRISNSTATLTVLVSSSPPPPYDLIIPAPVPTPAPAPTFSIDLPEIIISTPDAAGKNGGEIIITMRPFLSFTRHIITFITTEKNPAVVFSPEATPIFSQTWVTGGLGDGDHRTIQMIDDPQTNARTSYRLGGVKQPPVPTFQITAGGDQVIINDKTISSLKPGQTSTVTVGTEVFTIFPTAVVGLGSTITKPAPQGMSPPAPTATSGVLGGVPVIISGTQVVVDGSTLNIASQKVTTSVNGRRVVLGTGIVAVDRETLIFQDPSPRPTHEIVTGGEMITAIGNSIVVLHSTTITYGPNIAPNKTTINGETISIGPRGVSLHGTTLGGPLANATDTEYEIIGGITVGKLLPSLVVVNGATYSINQDGDPNNVETTVIDNQTITIGPDGLIVSSQTLTYPETSVTATLFASKNAISGFPTETGSKSGHEDEDDSGSPSTQPHLGLGNIMCICLAISLWMLT